MIKYQNFQSQKHVFMATLHAGFVHFNLIPNLGTCAYLIAEGICEHINGLPVTDDDVVLEKHLASTDVYVNVVFAGQPDSEPYVDPFLNVEKIGSYSAAYNDPVVIDLFGIEGMAIRAVRVVVDDWQGIRDGSFRRTIAITFYQSN